MFNLPTGKQSHSILESDARLNIWEGSVRSGKTIGSIIRWLEFVLTGPPGLLLMFGNTERTLKRNILEPIADLVGEDNFKHYIGSGEAVIYGRRVLLVGAHDERSEKKIRGMTLAGAYGDELTLTPRSFFTMLLSRLSVPGAKFFGTTNPDGPYHYLKTEYLDRQDALDLKRFSFTLDDNPSLDPAYVAALKAEYTGLWYRRFVLGEWCVADGAVYDMFDPDTHVVGTLPERFEQYVVGIDYGTANPTAFVLLGRSRGIWYVVREYHYDGRHSLRQKTDGEYSRDLREWLGSIRPASIEVDPSALSFKVQLRRDGLSSVHDADHAVIDGIRTVGKALSSGELLIHESCTHLIAELQGYTWDANAQEKGEDKPAKVNDHAADALRYAAQRVFTRHLNRVVAKPRGA